MTEGSKEGWRRVRFGDVVKLNQETSKDPAGDGLNRYVGLEHIEPGDLRIRSWGEIADGTTFTNRFRPGQVLFGKRRAYQRKVAVADFDGICSGDIYVLESRDTNLLLPELLPFICGTDGFFEHAVATSAGSLSPRTNWKGLAEYVFALPPLEEQLRMLSAFLAGQATIDALVDATTAARATYDSTLRHLYAAGSSSSNSDTNNSALPSGWQLISLGKRYEVQLGKMLSRTAREGDNQTLYLRNANVQWNRLDLAEVETMSFSERDQKKFALRYGDILACEGRHVGKSAMWREEIPGACYQKALHRLRPLSDQDEPEFLLHCLRFYSITGKFISETGETTIPHLAAERLRAMLFPFPELEEQQRVVSIIRELDRAAQSLDARIDHARGMIASLTGIISSRSHSPFRG